MKIVKKFSGFTQIELLLSMGILMILIGILTTVFGQILDVQLESKAVSSVDQNGRYILARLTYDFRSADDIVAPAAPGDISSSLQISKNSVNYTYGLNNGNLMLTVNGEDSNLNSNAANISNLTFTRIGNGNINDTIRVDFTITSKTQQTQGSNTKNFQTSLSLN